MKIENRLKRTGRSGERQYCFADQFFIANSFLAANPMFTPIIIAGYNCGCAAWKEDVVEESYEN